MANYYTLLTPAGLAKVTNAQLTNEKVEITQVAVGDANGTGYKPSGTETALKREVWRGGVASVEIDALNPNWIVVEAILPASVGGFTMREVALYDASGDMIAVGNYPDTYKPIANDGSTMDLALRTIIEVNNASNVTLKIDPNVIVASRAYVDAKVASAVGNIGTDLITLSEQVTKHLDENKHIGNNFSAAIDGWDKQSIANDTDTMLVMHRARFGDGSFILNDSIIKIKGPGKYLVYGRADYESNGAGERLLKVLKNNEDTDIKFTIKAFDGALHPQTLQCSSVIDLAENDNISLVTKQNSGNAINVVYRELVVVKIA